jgi:uncharacterized protein YkwD
MTTPLIARALRAVAVAALVALALASCTPGTAAVVSGGGSTQGTALQAEEARVVELLNAERSAAGLAPLAVHGGAVTVARSWAAELARRGQLVHNPDLAGQVSRYVTGAWVRIGENVGSAGDVDSLHRAFMASPGHRANFLNGEYDYVGVGLVRPGATIWVSIVFVAV